MLVSSIGLKDKALALLTQIDLGRRRLDRAFELGVRLLRLGDDGNVGAVAGRALCNGKPDAAARSRHEEGLACKLPHAHPAFATKPETIQRRKRNGSVTIA
jgi:hypothetical protein